MWMHENLHCCEVLNWLHCYFQFRSHWTMALRNVQPKNWAGYFWIMTALHWILVNIFTSKHSPQALDQVSHFQWLKCLVLATKRSTTVPHQLLTASSPNDGEWPVLFPIYLMQMRLWHEHRLTASRTFGLLTTSHKMIGQRFLCFFLIWPDQTHHSQSHTWFLLLIVGKRSFVRCCTRLTSTGDEKR